MKRPIITLLSDFGTADHYVGAMKGVILGICPQAEIVDITHDITPFSVPEAAYTLAQAWRCFPKGTIHVAVVDPGVGSARRAILAEVNGHRFIAPDNGLLSMVLDAGPKAAPLRAKVREITASHLFRHPVSSTFHGRDIFAPVAAHLAVGIDPKRVGDVITGTIVGDSLKPIWQKSHICHGTVLKVDKFGNIITNLDSASFGRIAMIPFKLKVGRHTVTRFRLTYGNAPKRQLFVLKGSSGFLEVSINQSDAASALDVQPGSKIELHLDTA